MDVCIIVKKFPTNIQRYHIARSHKDRQLATQRLGIKRLEVLLRQYKHRNRTGLKTGTPSKPVSSPLIYMCTWAVSRKTVHHHQQAFEDTSPWSTTDSCSAADLLREMSTVSEDRILNNFSTDSTWPPIKTYWVRARHIKTSKFVSCNVGLYLKNRLVAGVQCDVQRLPEAVETGEWGDGGLIQDRSGCSNIVSPG